jgi:hypothetical protein
MSLLAKVPITSVSFTTNFSGCKPTGLCAVIANWCQNRLWYILQTIDAPFSRVYCFLNRLCWVAIHQIRMHHNACFGKIAGDFGYLFYRCTLLSINFNNLSEATSSPKRLSNQMLSAAGTSLWKTFSNRMFVHHVTDNFLLRISSAKSALMPVQPHRHNENVFPCLRHHFLHSITE